MTILAIARNACLESIRQPVFIVLVLAGVLALVLNVNLAAFTMEDDTKLFVDLGLSTVFLDGLLLAAFTATRVLTREIENQTVLTVVSKPVPRPALVIGKYLGVVVALAVAYVSLAATLLLAVRNRVQAGATAEDAFDPVVITFSLLFLVLAVGGSGLVNYLFRRPFPSIFAVSLAACLVAALGLVWCIGRDWSFQSPSIEWNTQLMLAIVLVFEAVAVLAAVAIALSTRLGQMATLVGCLSVFLVGLVSEYFLGSVVADGNRPAMLRWLCWPLYALIPNLQFFWMADALSQGQAITLQHVATVSLYALFVVGGMLSLAVLLFQERDVG